jgi:hypothetical protein
VLHSVRLFSSSMEVEVVDYKEVLEVEVQEDIEFIFYSSGGGTNNLTFNSGTVLYNNSWRWRSSRRSYNNLEVLELIQNFRNRINNNNLFGGGGGGAVQRSNTGVGEEWWFWRRWRITAYRW